MEKLLPGSVSQLGPTISFRPCFRLRCRSPDGPVALRRPGGPAWPVATRRRPGGPAPPAGPAAAAGVPTVASCSSCQRHARAARLARLAHHQPELVEFDAGLAGQLPRVALDCGLTPFTMHAGVTTRRVLVKYFVQRGVAPSFDTGFRHSRAGL